MASGNLLIIGYLMDLMFRTHQTVSYLSSFYLSQSFDDLMKNCFWPVLCSFFAGVSCHRMWPSSIYYFPFLFIRIKFFFSFYIWVVVTNENMIEILFLFSYLTVGWQAVTGNDKILHLINSFKTDSFTEQLEHLTIFLSNTNIF